MAEYDEPKMAGALKAPIDWADTRQAAPPRKLEAWELPRPTGLMARESADSLLHTLDAAIGAVFASVDALAERVDGVLTPIGPEPPTAGPHGGVEAKKQYASPLLSELETALHRIDALRRKVDALAGRVEL